MAKKKNNDINKNGNKKESTLRVLNDQNSVFARGRQLRHTTVSVINSTTATAYIITYTSEWRFLRK